MTALRDTAKAKLNLTLEVLGRRADFYHEVRSLVGFTDLGDSVALEPGDELALAVDGPFAGALEGDNLIIAAAEAAKAEAPGIALGRFRTDQGLAGRGWTWRRLGGRRSCLAPVGRGQSRNAFGHCFG